MAQGKKLRRWVNYVCEIPATVHTIPRGDWAPHEESVACPCGPRVHCYRDGMHVIHHAWDGRDILERALDWAFTATN